MDSTVINNYMIRFRTHPLIPSQEGIGKDSLGEADLNRSLDCARDDGGVVQGCRRTGFGACVMNKLFYGSKYDG